MKSKPVLVEISFYAASEAKSDFHYWEMVELTILLLALFLVTEKYHSGNVVSSHITPVVLTIDS